MGRTRKPVVPIKVSDGNEYMIRWKRTKNLKWYYFPKLFDYKEDAIQQAELYNQDKYGQKAPYAIQVVTIHPVVAWGPEDDIQGSAVGDTVQENG